MGSYLTKPTRISPSGVLTCVPNLISLFLELIFPYNYSII
nr:MAG TPA: hypothetical protein [Caudoviricetes sp.]